MRATLFFLLLLFALANVARCATSAELQSRRIRAAAAFHDGILFIHANSIVDPASDGFRQDPAFYYFTGLADASDALLAVVGSSGKSWLFLSGDPPFSRYSDSDLMPGPDTATRLGIDHVVQWSALSGFLTRHSRSMPYMNGATPLYYVVNPDATAELPLTVTGGGTSGIPLWALAIQHAWPSFTLKDVSSRVFALMDVQSPDEISALRSAAKASVSAIQAAFHAVKPGVHQRIVESDVESACWSAGAHGSAFWPWIFGGKDAIFPHPFVALVRYDHLDAAMQSGDLARIDIGCEWEHYQGDLGRTVPVSGHFTNDQRKVWDLFVDAYQAAAKSLRDGVTEDQVFDAWRKKLLAHNPPLSDSASRNAIDAWSQRRNVPFWQIHATNLQVSAINGPLRAGSTIDLEPIAALDGQAYYLEDMYLITKDGAELLTPGVPYTAAQIESAMTPGRY